MLLSINDAYLELPNNNVTAVRNYASHVIDEKKSFRVPDRLTILLDQNVPQALVSR